VSDDDRTPDSPEADTPVVPDFTLIRKIGSGGFGTVWLAKNDATGRLAAVKLIPRLGSGASRELTSLTRLEDHARRQSPDLLPVRHVGKTREHLFYVMDLADDLSGEPPTADAEYRPATLDSRLQRSALESKTCLEYSRQLLRGLTSLHDAGMVHRDVKPANCLFVAGELKLADFGLLTDAGPEVSRLGTVTYMPPDGRMDTRADVYAAGLVVYEMLTGCAADRFPSLGPEPRRILEDPTLRALLRLSLTACSSKRDERYRDAQEMASALEQLLVDGGETARPRSRRTVIAMGVAVIALAAVGVGIGLSSLFDEVTPSSVDVSFITLPHFGAEVYLDGKPTLDDRGEPHTTPCTVEGVSARAHHVEFRLAGQPRLDAGEFDFAEIRQITATWPDGEDP